MSRSLTTQEELLEKIKDAVSDRSHFVIAIDGRAASGKSTLADYLSENLSASVVHTDDFYLPFEMRTDERLSEAGGNFHRERFYGEVVCNIHAKNKFKYGVFDCSSGRVSSERTVYPTGVVIVEGAYSMHPSLNKYYDMSVFVTADLKARIDRITERNGAQKAKVFASRWIPLEEVYFKTFNTELTADYVLNTDQP